MAVLNFPDILSEIFENLVDSAKFNSIINSTSDHKHLFNCLLVNRLWCRIAVSILWRQPFKPEKDHGYKAILVLLKCMDKKERKAIQNRGFKLEPVKQEPCFLYPSFLIGLNYRWFLNSVEIWCYKTPVKPQSGLLKFFKTAKPGKVAETEDVVFILQKLLQLFVDKNVKLKRLCISSIPREATDNKKYLVWADPKFQSLISPVRELAVSGQFLEQAADILTLSEKCRHVNRLVIYSFNGTNSDNDEITRENGKALAALIEKQNGLKDFCIRDGRGFSKYIMAALPSQKGTLTYIRFHKVNFRNCGPWAGLVECENLKKLAFFQCEHVTEVNVKPLFRANFAKLKKLEAIPPSGSRHGNDEHLDRWVRTMKF
ncbi:hypothetical protein G9A89_001840 [Geosiphon pyriformis]|nr:hypothetical protein G9A89_001840 [Geosiphon pyriformis]